MVLGNREAAVLGGGGAARHPWPSSSSSSSTSSSSGAGGAAVPEAPGSQVPARCAGKMLPGRTGFPAAKLLVLFPIPHG